jgi:hypothetical protein
MTSLLVERVFFSLNVVFAMTILNLTPHVHVSNTVAADINTLVTVGKDSRNVILNDT